MSTLTIQNPSATNSLLAMIPVAWQGGNGPGWSQTLVAPGGSVAYTVNAVYEAAIEAWAAAYNVSYTLD